MEASLDELRVDLDLVNKYQIEIFRRQFELEKQRGTGFVSDRAFDNLAYAAEHALILNNLLTEHNQAIIDYISWVNEGTVFFVRPEKGLIKADGFRTGLDWDAVVRIDGMIKFVLEASGISYLQISTPSMQERWRVIEASLRLERK